MSLLQTLEQNLLEAMKAKNEQKVLTLRMAKAAILNAAIEKKKNALEDVEILEVLQKQVKQRRESIDSFEKAGRQDLAAKEKAELEILSSYMPKQLSDEEIKSLVQKAIQSSGAKVKADAGKVMKVLMPEVKGKADGKRVNEILLSLLG